MSKHLKNDLERIERRLLALGARVEDAVRRSIAALETRRPDLALEVMAGDPEIDREEVELEEECLKALALHQPVANDLRIVAAVLKITSDLERIGDLAVNISERSSSLDRELPFPVPAGLQPVYVHQQSRDLAEILEGKDPTHTATWNAFCLADFGDRGVAFMALPQIPPRNTNWSGSGKWVHWAKVGFEKYYLRKIKQGKVEPFFEKYAMRLMGVQKLRG